MGKKISNSVLGDLEVAEDAEVTGMVGRTLRILRGAHVVVRGNVGGDVVIEKGATAEVHGLVGGSVRHVDARA